MFHDNTALVTGAAGGIGAAVVRALVEQGVSVAAVDVTPDGLAKLGHELVTPFVADVTDGAAVTALVAEVEDRLGPIGALVNAAGVLRTGRAHLLTDEDWATTFAVNTTGVFHTCRAVAARMIARRGGSIVTVASNAAGIARMDMAAYAASKAAATSFTRCLGLELAEHGIRCNVVAPGSTHTPMLTGLWDEGDAVRASVEGVPSAFRTGIPLGRVAQPSDVADAVLYVLSDRASHITMQTLTVDGGAALGA
ncbi:2,3-dihydro-2,3-dihydroxybenzoate dehydrogenase [Saccharothrix sp. S26]|uniref:2,3-dihydro-2,3-dihydroxybenzoate dehydrogenase n=1 Tax=Saccharothrix sp. S26 TaxID=2907215 RepID=UPI001F253A0A|nr:2,3-dihydro-2,3-dihydroxybenzoate dehydrogenase [Saccharothrix sp. S26]MCE6996407.1 2,3-dihydro-2,3-dihydroxybenzoate dehydrogenase [Saccharothrix sp. S26]